MGNIGRSKLVWLALFGLAGCAQGAAGFGLDSGLGGNLGDGSASDGQVDAADELDTGTPNMMVDAGKKPDAGRDAAVDAGPPDCPATNTCASATALTSINGDTGSPMAMASGKGGSFLEIEIKDEGGTFNGDNTLKAKFTLTSPSGANYDLFVKLPSDSGGHANSPRDCSRPEQSSQLAVGDDVIGLSWKDETNGLGESAGDGLIVSIEVRHISGDCDGTWNLLVEGNKN